MHPAHRHAGIGADPAVAAIAAAALVPLLVAAGGDRAEAERLWSSRRSEIDAELLRMLAEDEVEVSALLAAVGASLSTGTGDAEQLMSQAMAAADDPLSRADAHRTLAKLGTWRGDTLRAAALAEWAADEVSGHDVQRELGLRLDAATALLQGGHLLAAEAAARRALAVDASDPDLTPVTEVLLNRARMAQGGPLGVPTGIPPT